MRKLLRVAIMCVLMISCTGCINRQERHSKTLSARSESSVVPPVDSVSLEGSIVVPPVAMQGEYVSGKVVKVIDGDTFDILIAGNSTIRVRMDAIDAPERGMPFSKKARQYLGDLCLGQMVKVSRAKDDGRGRIISFSYLEDGRELSREMLKAGFAWHFKEYNSDPGLAALEEEARRESRGLWRDKNPMTPWENRRLHRKGISTKGMFETTEE